VVQKWVRPIKNGVIAIQRCIMDHWMLGIEGLGIGFATPRNAAENDFINQLAKTKMVTSGEQQKGTWIGPAYVNGVGWREKRRQGQETLLPYTNWHPKCDSTACYDHENSVIPD